MVMCVVEIVRRIAIVALLSLMLPGCTGQFFYHDIIVPTYKQVDPSTKPASDSEAIVP